MSVAQAEYFVRLWARAHWVPADVWYEAMAVLLGERAPA